MTLPLLPQQNPAVIFFLPADFADTDVAPVPWLADPIDPITGQLLSIEQGFDPVDSAVITATRTVRGSGSAVEDVGQQYASAPLVENSLQQFLRLETGLSLRHLVDAGDLILLNVDPDGFRDVGLVRFTYKSRNSADKKPLSAATGAR